MIYRVLFRLVATKLDPETAHHLGMLAIRAAGSPLVRPVVGLLTRPHRSLAVSALGTRFPSPFGIAAGFDKDAVGIAGLDALGFGMVEVGTVTPKAQSGNPRPRLFRLTDDRALINRMGFNNLGSRSAADRLANREALPIRVGANIGKNRTTAVDRAVDDYARAARDVAAHADFLVVNVSSPNTPGLRGLQNRDQLAPILHAVVEASGEIPVLVKIAPELGDDELADVAGLVDECGLAGIVATNTTVSRSGLATPEAKVAEMGAGGLSGAPLRERSLEVLRILRKLAPDACIISVGGVETAADVQQRLDAGATLVQGYTAFIYRGPLWAREINRGLRRLRAERSRAGA